MLFQNNYSSHQNRSQRYKNNLNTPKLKKLIPGMRLLLFLNYWMKNKYPEPEHYIIWIR
jgi:hypothetical protein